MKPLCRLHQALWRNLIYFYLGLLIFAVWLGYSAAAWGEQDEFEQYQAGCLSLAEANPRFYWKNGRCYYETGGYFVSR